MRRRRLRDHHRDARRGHPAPDRGHRERTRHRRRRRSVHLHRVKPILRRYLREGFADFARTEQAVRDSDLDWTIMRPPRLTDGKHRPYRTAIDRNVRGGITIARVDLALAILAALDNPTTAGHTISLGY
ncbi:NAD(P)H-binding protein [Micromonospora sp. NPDC003776]